MLEQFLMGLKLKTSQQLRLKNPAVYMTPRPQCAGTSTLVANTRIRTRKPGIVRHRCWRSKGARAARDGWWRLMMVDVPCLTWRAQESLESPGTCTAAATKIWTSLGPWPGLRSSRRSAGTKISTKFMRTWRCTEMDRKRRLGPGAWVLTWSWTSRKNDWSTMKEIV